jgi:1-deoxy-D-xylulose-5-phosphate reductoisomerase
MLNAANEVAVAAFLDGRIRYLEIAAIIEDVLNLEPAIQVEDLEAVFAADGRARMLATQWLERHGR